MSQDDQAKWDRKWRQMAAGAGFSPNPLLLKQAPILAGGAALDLACGPGHNTIWLAERGYAALGVDISRVALATARREARRQGLFGQGAGRACFERVDLDTWRPAAAAFDLLIVFRFLDRRLWEPIRQAVRPGGLFICETRHSGILARLPASTPDYLLAPGELFAVFAGWTILDYEEGEENAAIVARKP
jgi:SAM-dependent methyltransferase